MANKSVVLYQTIKIKNKKKWTFRRAEGTLRDLVEGAYYLSFYDATGKRMIPVGRVAKEAEQQLTKKQAELLYVANGDRC